MVQLKMHRLVVIWFGLVQFKVQMLCLLFTFASTGVCPARKIRRGVLASSHAASIDPVSLSPPESIIWSCATYLFCSGAQSRNAPKHNRANRYKTPGQSRILIRRITLHKVLNLDSRLSSRSLQPVLLVNLRQPLHCLELIRRCP